MTRGWSRALTLATLAVWLFIAVFSARHFLRSEHAGGGSSDSVGSAIARTVGLRETVFSNDGRVRRGLDSVLAVRSDGSYAYSLDTTLADGDRRPSAQRLIVFASGLRVETDEILERKSTTTISPDALWAAHRDPRKDCLDSLGGQRFAAGETLVGEDKIQEFRVVRIRTRGGTNLWLSPDLGCALLKSRRGDPGGGYSEKIVVSVERGEPSEWLFTVPDRFKEVRPSVLYGLSGEAGRARDERYESRRPRGPKP